MSDWRDDDSDDQVARIIMWAAALAIILLCGSGIALCDGLS